MTVETRWITVEESFEKDDILEKWFDGFHWAARLLIGVEMAAATGLMASFAWKPMEVVRRGAGVAFVVSIALVAIVILAMFVIVRLRDRIDDRTDWNHEHLPAIPEP